MPHTARKKSESGFYHVVPKGIADQIIFEDDADRHLYLQLLSKAAGNSGILVHAYCLMSNHVHLIVEDRGDNLSDCMKYLHERYAMHFAKVMGRTGGVFRKPYWSEPIETDPYLLCAIRYVHANPAAAGICKASVYRWSSMGAYLEDGDGITTTGLILDMAGGKEGFLEFSDASNSTALPFPGSRLKGHLSDEEALRLAREVLEMDDVNLARLQPSVRREKLEKLRDHSFSVRQLSRICGISTATINKALSWGSRKGVSPS